MCVCVCVCVYVSSDGGEDDAVWASVHWDMYQLHKRSGAIIIMSYRGQ